MLLPRKVKHRKQHRGRTQGLTKGGASLSFGEYGIQALEPGWLTARQMEAALIAMTRAIKRGGKVWINIFPDKPVTKKPADAEPETQPLLKEADPELEKLLDEEEAIARRTHDEHETPHFRGED